MKNSVVLRPLRAEEEGRVPVLAQRGGAEACETMRAAARSLRPLAVPSLSTCAADNKCPNAGCTANSFARSARRCRRLRGRISRASSAPNSFGPTPPRSRRPVRAHPALMNTSIVPWADLRALGTVAATSSLLAASPRLAKALASLAYHHHPTHLPHTRNALRLQWAAPAPVWDPTLARQSDQLRRRRARDAGDAQFGDGVDCALDEVKKMAETNRGVLLGRRA